MFTKYDKLMLNKSDIKMKKIVMLFAAAAMTVSAAFAQDLNAVTELYNNGAMELDMGNKETALDYFQTALTQAEALGEEGAMIVENCKMTIPILMISVANDLIEAQNYDAAIEWYTKAEEAANLYGDAAKAADAAAKKSQLLMKKASELVKAKDYANAIVVYEQIMAADPNNGRAALTMGQAYNALGDTDKAEAAFAVAAANGQEKQANKQLSKMYVKKASASLKAKKTQEAYDFAMKANEYLEDATAYKIAGQCAMTLGKTADALPLLEKYVELSPNASDANQMKFNIAATAQKLGDKAKAKTYYEQVISDPKLGAQAQAQLNVLNK
jgi:tetratricopeptide (TPR) repeat protein